MSLRRGELNPLGILGFRKLQFIPAHFTVITVPKNLDTRLLEHWINFNLNGRYAIIRSLNLDQNSNKMIEVIEIGLEDSKEATLLTLGCQLLHQ